MMTASSASAVFVVVRETGRVKSLLQPLYSFRAAGDCASACCRRCCSCNASADSQCAAYRRACTCTE
jgi:hypothetical protein